MILLNEHERKEFEHHKKIAEEQLNKMYFGSNKGAKNNGKLEMPPFLSSPNKQQTNEKTFIQSKNQPHKTSDAQNHNTPPKANFKGGKNLLNLLNLKDLKIDNDRLIILAICLLLSGEDVDEILMLALLYIML